MGEGLGLTLDCVNGDIRYHLCGGSRTEADGLRVELGADSGFRIGRLITDFVFAQHLLQMHTFRCRLQLPHKGNAPPIHSCAPSPIQRRGSFNVKHGFPRPSP